MYFSVLILTFYESLQESILSILWFQGQISDSIGNIIVFILLLSGLLILLYIGYRVLVNKDTAHSKNIKTQKIETAGISPFETDTDQTESIIHEIQQPLSAMTMLADFARNTIKEPASKKRDDTILENIELIAQQSKRCSRIIEDMQNPGAADQSKFKPVKINRTMRQALKVALTSQDGKQFKVRQRLEKNLPVIYADGDGIHQLFTNIIDNAIDAMQDCDDRYLTITTRRRPHGITIKISDTGCGIEEEFFDKIFEARYTTKGENGSGLGLAICQNIVNDHEGRITAKSNKAGGASFQIFLPYK